MNGSGRAAAAATIIRECRRELAARGSSVIREVLGASATVDDWRHYPAGDGYDPVNHSQYFYHRHHADEPGEHGHFHLFLRAEGMPEGTLPLLLPEAAIANLPTPPQAAPVKRGARDEVSHLIAIAVDQDGEPVRLFTTNRWVTGETWYRAEDVIRMADRFALDAAEPAGLVNAWLVAMLRLYQPEIAMLLRERDRTVMDPRRRRRRIDVFEDPRLEVTSSLAIDLESRLAAVDRLAIDHPSVRHTPAPSRLPPMAEGWGS
ncbi:MAG TPA: hypothetical protein VFQ90_03370 [Stellaceae bacterium]|nr:hypothetical protein [Stellaceae bacterium]